MKAIRSADNPRFKVLRKLVQSSQERKKTGLSVLDGTHLVGAYREHVGLPEQVAVSSSGRADVEVQALLARLPGVEQLELRDELFEKVSSVVTPTGIIGLVRTPQPELVARELGACVLVEELQDPGNLGSILRSAAASGIADVLLSKNSVRAWSPRVLRAAMGAHFLLRVHEDADLAAVVQQFQGKVIATSPRGRPLFEADLSGNVALVFGNEGGGISPGLLSVAHTVVTVPMPGRAESLNVAAAAAVCLFERVRQMSASRSGA
ncbi:MAG TPA: RNA methyltransferase [Burkholderiales bacterium]|nr:RNA methyltransferase [Burkholderiales bacterium]